MSSSYCCVSYRHSGLWCLSSSSSTWRSPLLPCIATSSWEGQAVHCLPSGTTGGVGLGPARRQSRGSQIRW